MAMLYRKISTCIEAHLRSGDDKIMVVEGARQIGKSFIIREVGNRLYKNFVEINFAKDYETDGLFRNIHGLDEFYITLSMVAGGKLGDKSDTLVFLDEIQHYPQYLTMLKFMREDDKFAYIASGSLLGIALRNTVSIPIGSIIRKQMYQLDFEEWLMAEGWGKDSLDYVHDCYQRQASLSEAQHEKLLGEFKKYLLVGGMPDAVNTYMETHNIVRVREVQESIRNLYKEDAAKYEKESSKKLLVRRIYDMIVSQMENKKKRIVAKDIREKRGDRFEWFAEEFEYLVSSGIALDVHAISNPKYPLSESVHKNLLKLYLNDVGILTGRLYEYNIAPVMKDERNINLGSVYESVVAQELKAHGHDLFYYDNAKKGEVDFLVNNVAGMTVLPIEVKSGKDFTSHKALDRFLANKEYNIPSGIVLDNEREVYTKDNVTYMPIYYIMCIRRAEIPESNSIF
ncbi:ATP-binding protein [Sodaliphilus sp.]|uniref:ATP-binding protein n=1 Tax=Sodaliphilus sp. TaxID=2815818 RepID=UPI00388F8BE8